MGRSVTQYIIKDDIESKRANRGKEGIQAEILMALHSITRCKTKQTVIM